MRFIPLKSDAYNGAIVYAAGDLIASLLLDEFSIIRFIGMMLVGGTIYAWEIPTYFRWIDHRTENMKNQLYYAFTRIFLALMFFNPLWIFRHLVFIAVLNGNFNSINLALFNVAYLSWLVNIPISIIANAIIQLAIPFKWRFFGNAIFSGMMVIYYAMSGIWFNTQ